MSVSAANDRTAYCEGHGASMGQRGSGTHLDVVQIEHQRHAQVVHLFCCSLSHKLRVEPCSGAREDVGEHGRHLFVQRARREGFRGLLDLASHGRVFLQHTGEKLGHVK